MNRSCTRRALTIAVFVVGLILGGCATGRGEPTCPDVSGSYTNQSGDKGERLAPLLLGDAAPNTSTVSLSMDWEHYQLRVAAGPRKGTLKQGADFVCDARGLRLVKPLQGGIDLGEMLVHQVSVFHTFSKASDGSLVAVKTIKERASIANVALSRPEREAESLRWRATAPLAIC
jgi:hypothetical protein